jgi:hypothetical protein
MTYIIKKNGNVVDERAQNWCDKIIKTNVVVAGRPLPHHTKAFCHYYVWLARGFNPR